MTKLFDVQPEQYRKPLIPNENTKKISKELKRILYFDPTEIYKSVNKKRDPFKRYESVSMVVLFPNKKNGLCGCGCGAKLVGRRTRWATDSCRLFTQRVFSIIAGDFSLIRFLIEKYHGCKCSVCDETKNLDLDHIFPIKFGGGGAWLTNYTLLCKFHHREKTNKDFNWKSKINKK